MKSDWSDMPDEMLQEIEEIRDSLESTEKGQPRNTKENCVIALENDPLMKGAICQDLFTDRPCIIKNLGWVRDDPAITDDDLCQIYLYLEKFYGLTVERNILNAIRVVAQRHPCHPVRDYLESLTWDGRERIRKVLHHFLGAPEDDLTYECLKLFMLGAVERVYHPGCKFEIMLCLVGDQGLGKSSFFRFLALKDEWFSDDLKRMDDENVYRKMQGHWIIEMAEMLGTASAKSVEEIKAFLSRQKETYKVPYDRFPKDRRRQCVFVGTSNKQRFLPLDRTGNRRFYPIQTNIEEAEAHVLDDEAAARAYMNQLWAELMVIYRSGDWSLTLPLEMEHRLGLLRMNFMAEDTSTGMVQAFLDDYDGDYVCTKLLYNECYHMLGEPDRKNIGEINDIMNNTIDGWVPGPQHRFDRYGQQRSWVREKRPDREGTDLDHVVSDPEIGEFRQLSLDGFTPCKQGASPF